MKSITDFGNSRPLTISHICGICSARLPSPRWFATQAKSFDEFLNCAAPDSQECGRQKHARELPWFAFVFRLVASSQTFNDAENVGALKMLDGDRPTLGV